MPNPPLRVVPELLYPCRAAKGVVGALIVVALVVLIATTPWTRTNAPLLAMQQTPAFATATGDRQPPPRTEGMPASAEYFPSNYTLHASEPTPHIEAF